ncbi:GyrI-like domain-containing protein [Planctomycetota bacterium]|nr:GyrI-like domain-containing protein [Planctomycetota bacterium]
MTITNPLVVKDAPQFTVLAYTRDVTFAEIPSLAGEILPKIFDFVNSKLDTSISGPAIFQYGPSEKPDHMNLIIAIPVLSKEGLTVDSDEFQLQQLPPQKVVSIEYAGSMANIAQAWEQFYKLATEANLSFECGNGREIYTIWIDFDSPDNRTELQIFLNE